MKNVIQNLEECVHYVKNLEVEYLFPHKQAPPHGYVLIAMKKLKYKFLIKVPLILTLIVFTSSQ